MYHHAETSSVLVLEVMSQLNLYHDVHSAVLRGETLTMPLPYCMNVHRSNLSSGKTASQQIVCPLFLPWHEQRAKCPSQALF